MPTLPSLQEGFNWHIVGYTCASLLIVTSSYLAYTGIITSTSIYDGFKVVGSSIWHLMGYFGFGLLDGTDSPSSGPGGAGGSKGGLPTSGSSGAASIEDEAKEAWMGSLSSDKGKGRSLDSVVIDRPAIINVGLSNSKQIELPLDSAAFKAIRHKIAWFFERRSCGRY